MSWQDVIYNLSEFLLCEAVKRKCLRCGRIHAYVTYINGNGKNWCVGKTDEKSFECGREDLRVVSVLRVKELKRVGTGEKQGSIRDEK